MKTKKILFICNKLETFKIKTDSTYLLMLTAQTMGFEIFYTTYENIEVNSIKKQVTLFSENYKIKITNSLSNLYSKSEWFKILAKTICSLEDFAAILVRTDPPFNMEYYYLTQMLSIIKSIKIINNPLVLRNFNEKLIIFNFPDLIAPTIVTKNTELIYDFIKQQKDCVIKQLDLMAGLEIYKIGIKDKNLKQIIEDNTNNGNKTVMVQKFIPEVTEGDKRIFIVNGKVIDYYLCRIPAKNSIISNIAQGGTGIVKKLTIQDKQIANKIAKWLKKEGVTYAGIDLIDKYLTEINITSPTGMHQILEYSNINIAKLILNTL